MGIGTCRVRPASRQSATYIYTASKQPWVLLPADTPAGPEYYSARDYRPAESQARWRALKSG